MVQQENDQNRWKMNDNFKYERNKSFNDWKKVVNERWTNEMKTSQTRPSLVTPYLSAGKILNLFCGSKSAGLSFLYILNQ